MALQVSRKQRRLLLAAVVLVGGWLAQQAGLDLSAWTGRTPVASPQAASAAAGPASRRGPDRAPDFGGPREGGDSAADSATERIERAFAARESGFMVTVEAEVVKLLRDDLDGSRHQRFLIELEGGRTLLVAHNIDLAERASIREGDPVRVRGQYEWNDRGGVLHWTHHDPEGDHPGGFIEAAGRRVE